MPSSTPIHSNWTFTQVGQHGDASATAKDEWLPTSTFPTSVHAELIKLGKIPDPYIGLNEWDVQCKIYFLLQFHSSRPCELATSNAWRYSRGTIPITSIIDPTQRKYLGDASL